MTDDGPVDARLIFENREGFSRWNIQRGFWERRRPGLSAMMRVKNEGQFLAYAVASIADWHDEICLFLQGEQEDDTAEVAMQLEAQYPGKVKVFKYEFDSVPNGPGHDRQPRGSVYERAYFYNWCLSLTSCEFADKWDGDMIAHEWLGPAVRAAMARHDGIFFRGLDLAGPDLGYESGQTFTATEQRVHRVTERTFYFTYTHCEHFSGTRAPEHLIANACRLVDRPGFLHLKWCKSSPHFSGVGWPDDWQTAHPYYREIRDRKRPARPYRGAYPAALRPYLERRR